MRDAARRWCIGTHIYINQEDRPRDVGGYPAWTTALDYLRANSLTGTKEGCATGDCGACTATTVSLADGRLVYESLNTCIAPLHSLAGQLLITVEGLASNGALHPVQRAMVERHGSQCGFCTPGFVMSLFTHVKHGAKGGREELVRRLSGNLCRCTGYLPIIRAGLDLKPGDGRDQYHRDARRIAARLRQLQGSGRSPDRPRTVAALARRMAAKDRPRMVAGATDLGLELTQELAEPELVFTHEARTLSKLKETEIGWQLGAGVTWEQVDQALSPHLPGLRTMLARFGSPQIRARATVGGNIGNASPIADGPPVFLVLDGRLTLRKGNMRRTVALRDFYTGYRKTVLRRGEFIETVTLRRPGRRALFNVYKVSKRVEDDISAVCGAFMVELDKAGKVKLARVAYGGMAAVPRRASRCEGLLVGRRWDENTVELACAALGGDFRPMSDLRASARYRSVVAGNLLRRFHAWTKERGQVSGDRVQ